MKSMMTAFSFLTAIGVSSALALDAGTTFPVAPQAGKAPQGQFGPSAAFGADKYLVVWRAGQDNRDAKLFAARVDKSGKPLDPAGIELAKGVKFQHESRVAFGGGVFLVVFSGLKDKPGADGLLQSGVFAVRVAPDGKVLDEKPVAIGAAPGHQAQPAVAFDGTNFRVAWVARLEADTWVGEAWGITFKGLLEIRTARVSPAGQALDASPGVLAARGPGGPTWDGLGANYHPVVASAGGKVMIAFSHGASYPQAVVFDAGQPGPPDKAARVDLLQVGRKVGRLEGKVIHPVLAGSPKSFIASWRVTRGRGCNGPPWTAMIFDLDGKPIDKDAKGVSPGGGSDRPCLGPALAFDGEAFVWTWFDSNEQKLLASRVSTDGRTLEAKDLVLEQMAKDKAGRFMPADFSSASLASDGAGSTLCVYHRYPTEATGRVEIVGRLIRK